MIEPEGMRHWRAIMDSAIEKAGADDPETFAFFARLLDETRHRLPEAAAVLRRPGHAPDGREIPGYSWAAIARALGVSVPGAWRRFHDKEEL